MLLGMLHRRNRGQRTKNGNVDVAQRPLMKKSMFENDDTGADIVFEVDATITMCYNVSFSEHTHTKANHRRRQPPVLFLQLELIVYARRRGGGGALTEVVTGRLGKTMSAGDTHTEATATTRHKGTP